MFILLHGPDDLLRSEHLAALRAALGPEDLAELSTTWLDGRKTTAAEIRHHADALPFLTARRLVVVEGFLAQLQRFLQRHGHRCMVEAELLYPRWVEAPEQVIVSLATYLTMPTAPTAVNTDAARRREEATVQVERKLNWWQRRGFRIATSVIDFCPTRPST